MEPLEAVPCHGIYLGPGCGVGVRFGDCPQDVVAQLGQPTRVVRKTGVSVPPTLAPARVGKRVSGQGSFPGH
jgi:hypothetical protein